jgi:hypothetical protein
MGVLARRPLSRATGLPSSLGAPVSSPFVRPRGQRIGHGGNYFGVLLVTVPLPSVVVQYTLVASAATLTG